MVVMLYESVVFDSIYQLPVAVDNVGSLVELYDGVEEVVDTLLESCRSRYYWYSNKFTESLDVETVASFAELIVEIESHYRTYVHIDDLCRQIEVSLQVARVDDVDDYYVITHKPLFGRESRNRIRAG